MRRVHVHLDGKAVKSCTMLAVQADGASVTTIEGMADGDDLHPLQTAFWEKHGLQCGFCTPGMIMVAADLLARDGDPDEEEIRHASRATSAAAPATTTSSPPCRPPLWRCARRHGTGDRRGHRVARGEDR